MVNSMLKDKENKYLVFDFDDVGLTGLHWAVKRNYLDLIKLLYRKGAIINSSDIMQRTPLYLATCEGNDEAVSLLL